MATFDNNTINYGRVAYNSSSVFVYRSYCDRVALTVPCGTVINAYWVGRTVHVKMSNGWTYVYEGFGSYTRNFPS
jgi:hypothetical protein